MPNTKNTEADKAAKATRELAKQEFLKRYPRALEIQWDRDKLHEEAHQTALMTKWIHAYGADSAVGFYTAEQINERIETILKRYEKVEYPGKAILSIINLNNGHILNFKKLPEPTKPVRIPKPYIRKKK
jgi:hypothetical protein